MNDKADTIESPLPRRLATARKKVGISQKKLGIAVGMDEFAASARMNQYETGKHAPPYSTLERIAKELNVPLPYFYTEDDETAELLLQFHKLSDEEKQELLAMAVRLH